MTAVQLNIFPKWIFMFFHSYLNSSFSSWVVSAALFFFNEIWNAFHYLIYLDHSA